MGGGGLYYTREDLMVRGINTHMECAGGRRDIHTLE